MRGHKRLLSAVLLVWALLMMPYLFLPHSPMTEFLRGLGSGLLIAVPVGLLLKTRTRS